MAIESHMREKGNWSSAEEDWVYANSRIILWQAKAFKEEMRVLMETYRKDKKADWGALVLYEENMEWQGSMWGRWEYIKYFLWSPFLLFDADGQTDISVQTGVLHRLWCLQMTLWYGWKGRGSGGKPAEVKVRSQKYRNQKQSQQDRACIYEPTEEKWNHEFQRSKGEESAGA